MDITPFADHFYIETKFFERWDVIVFQEWIQSVEALELSRIREDHVKSIWQIWIFKIWPASPANQAWRGHCLEHHGGPNDSREHKEQELMSRTWSVRRMWRGSMHNSSQFTQEGGTGKAQSPSQLLSRVLGFFLTCPTWTAHSWKPFYWVTQTKLPSDRKRRPKRWQRMEMGSC